MRIALVLAGLCAATAAFATECRQDRANYTDRDGGYELAFEPVGSDAAATSQRLGRAGIVVRDLGPARLRASFGCWNSEADVDRFVAGLVSR